jgi:hypothetical protein
MVSSSEPRRPITLSVYSLYAHSALLSHPRRMCCADVQAEEWRSQQARAWARQVHPLLKLRQVLPQGTLRFPFQFDCCLITLIIEGVDAVGHFGVWLYSNCFTWESS